MIPRRAATRLAITGGALILLLVLLAILSLAIVNRRMLPRAWSGFERRAESACGCELSVERVRYRMLRRIDLSSISIATRVPEASVAIERVRIRVPLRTLFTLARGGTGAITGAVAASETVWDGVHALAGEELLPLSAELRDTAVELTLPAGRTQVRIPRVELLHAADDPRLTVTVVENDGALPEFTLLADYDAREVEFSGELANIDLTLLSSAVAAGAGRAAFQARYRHDGSVSGTGALEVDGLSLDAPVLADQPVDVAPVRYAFDVDYLPEIIVSPRFQTPPPFPHLDFATGELRFSRGDLSVGALELDLRPNLRGVTGGSTPSAYDAAPITNRTTWFLAESDAGRAISAVPRLLELEIGVTSAPLAALIGAVPEVLLGPLAVAEGSGALSWNATARVPLHTIGWMDLEGRAEANDLTVTAMPASMNVHKLRRSFPHLIVDPATGFRQRIEIPAYEPPPLAWLLRHSERTLRYLLSTRERQDQPTGEPRLIGSRDDVGTVRSSASSSPTYTYRRLTEISDWVISAVLTAEDGDFFFHEGVSFTTLPRAIERNLMAGEIQFGASTITMQLAKMLFLDQERVFSRKLQEVLLVFLIEHYVPVPKSRILELYLNLAEFGPGVFGIDQAARYYFAKSPEELDAGEATWLASILPAPRRYHAYYEAGAITPGWFARMQGLYAVMLERGRMTQEEYDAAMEGPPEFALPQ